MAAMGVHDSWWLMVDSTAPKMVHDTAHIVQTSFTPGRIERARPNGKSGSRTSAMADATVHTLLLSFAHGRVGWAKPIGKGAAGPRLEGKA